MVWTVGEDAVRFWKLLDPRFCWLFCDYHTHRQAETFWNYIFYNINIENLI